MNGILCIDKPRDFTSHDVVAKMRGMAATRKIGHAGTLDPFATGVLPLFLGSATRFCDLLPDQDKRYTAVFQLGVVTDTQDMTGRVLETCDTAVTAAQLVAALRCFTGEIRQTPPMYSAVRVGGVRLYDLARQGVEVERRARTVYIHSLELLGGDEAAGVFTVDVRCSKGTYIRTLCHDVGRLLGCGAALRELRRTVSCGFALEQCLTLEQAQQLADRGQLPAALLPVEQAFAGLPRWELPAQAADRFVNGVRLPLDANVSDGTHTVYREGVFLGLARPDRENGVWRHVRLLARN